MNSTYLEIKNISSLEHILTYLKGLDNPKDVYVFFDWDDTLVNPDDDMIIEPDVTIRLFKYMKNKQIPYAIITGRFYDTACDDEKRNLLNMQYNITDTMYPSLKYLGVNVDRFQTKEMTENPYKIIDEQGVCVGLVYMGIIFSDKKGAAIRNYLKNNDIRTKNVLFIDDYEPYLIETTSSFPSIKAYRRFPPYTRLN